MTEADRDDVIFELHLAEGEADRNATLVRLVRVYPDLREDLVDHWCEIVLMELRAAAYPEPECPPVDEGVAARALARFYEMEAGLAGGTVVIAGGRPVPARSCATCFDQPYPALACPSCRGSGDPCRPWSSAVAR
ncbi:hypothetical protein AU375_04081 [Methylobacterium radiotolerans]|nr:hypothetical protein AU375_04081 [Methylobacterium radiotolerans]